MSAPIHPGRLIPNFGVECGMCKRHTISTLADSAVGIARTKTQAKQVLNCAGWYFTRAWGWICPCCNQFSSAGVVPEPASHKTPPLKPQEPPK
jgi:hypothetical protein